MPGSEEGRPDLTREAQLKRWRWPSRVSQPDGDLGRRQPVRAGRWIRPGIIFAGCRSPASQHLEHQPDRPVVGGLLTPGRRNHDRDGRRDDGPHPHLAGADRRFRLVTPETALVGGASLLLVDRHWLTKAASPAQDGARAGVGSPAQQLRRDVYFEPSSGRKAPGRQARRWVSGQAPEGAVVEPKSPFAA